MGHERCDMRALDARDVLSETADFRFVEAIKAEVMPRDGSIDTNQAALVETQKMFGGMETPKCLGGGGKRPDRLAVPRRQDLR